jgi:hypothetical protein
MTGSSVVRPLGGLPDAAIAASSKPESTASSGVPQIAFPASASCKSSAGVVSFEEVDIGGRIVASLDLRAVREIHIVRSTCLSSMR